MGEPDDEAEVRAALTEYLRTTSWVERLDQVTNEDLARRVQRRRAAVKRWMEAR